MAQMGMVMNLDKCIGCHTCSVTCKQAWTNRSGVEYVWFNNVETRPGQGYPRRYQDQERWKGGWVRNRRGRLTLKAGGRFKKLLTIFANPVLPNIRDYYEPWTYDYEKLTDAPLGDDFPVAQPKSLLSGEPMAIEWSANWDDDLGGAPEHGPRDPIVERLRRAVRGRGALLLRAGVHVLPAAHLRALPQPVLRGVVPVGGDVQARRGRDRAGRPGPVPGLADVRHRLPVQEGVLQPPHRQGREVHVLLPAHRGRPAHRLLRDLRGAAALHRAVPLRRRPRHRRRLGGGRARPLRSPARPAARPERPGGDRPGPPRRHRRGLDRRRPALAGVQAGQGLPGGAAAASGVPDHADGLVHPAAVPGGRPAHRDRARRRGRGQPVRRDRRAAHPGGVPRGAVHRGRPGTGARRAAEAGGDAVLHAGRDAGPAAGRVGRRPPSG